ncbi:hypothetical protein PFICI_02132 [Pestalotiopsis fici W106-1]|uniref:Uncharacterized protein n=1 Tax=Pestalotiopsis fici (strain W106-1 / CGMCC3.15140) TaxID=1229662 RepID=W3XFA3_PESFW|nr:uncharacterized protein PFICI_02132 [Pestalotiopsis fici W106-1]ETS84107.1 hypothetical protein PFICI_02132 [Pestalotiopsis fici W106-1]
MDFLRSRMNHQGDLPGEHRIDLEQGRTSEVPQGREAGHNNGQEQGQTRWTRLRPRLSFISPARSQEGARSVTRTNVDLRADGSRKTSRLHLGLPSIPSARLAIPNIARTRTHNGSRQPRARESTPDGTEDGSRASFQRPRTERPTADVEMRSTIEGSESSHRQGRRLFRGRQRAEMHLTDVAGSRAPGRRGDDHARSERGAKPQRFLFCFPWIQSRRIRSQILRCFVSGMFLLLMLAIYLALSVTKNINNSEFTILLILIILFVTIFFCHGLIRLCMLIVKPRSDDDENRARLPEMFGPGGYAVPRRPIRVLLARDEEAAGLESETTKLQPPAYGLWRESVRVDPNRIYWQRNDEPPSSADTTARPATANRPPSYISDDGIEYVVEARPRSMAPLSDMLVSNVSLPPHPSEAGRLQHAPDV